MRKKLFTFLLALATSVGLSWATTTDLASITDNYTAQDGEILTGTLGVNVKISIADGATVTLLNANINGDKTWTTGDYAGLTCLGDATITIVGKNSVSGFSTENGYPGIYVPSGKTLIINGTGSLTAQSSTEEAAGIGAGRNTHCGNIEIQSGKITAIASGEEGAGIGGAFNANCGNITISGGIVTAVGGYRGVGIGGGRRSGSTNAGHCGNILISGGVVSATSGEQAAAIGGGRGNNNSYKTNCGTITITNTALKVYAHQGGSSTNTIGAGKYGTCGTVTINGNTGVINDDPYTYQTKEDGEIVVDYINAIGTVVYTQECKDKIDIARELYDALTDAQKALVGNYSTLTDAEAAYDALIPTPVVVTANTLQLHVNDALMGSVALQNPSNDIFDNGDGTYDVPEGAEVTLLATPNEGYEFIGWKASSSICDFNECEFVALPTVANPLTFDMYNEAAFMAEFAAVAPADNSVKLYNNFSGEWADTEAFGIFDDYTSEYAKISMILEPGDYQFAVKVGGELRGDGTAFSRNKQACILGEGLTANLTLNVDVKGTYRFYWFYDENRFAMDVPNVCGMYWKNVTNDEFEVTLGQEGEVTLPKVYTTNMGFATNIFNGVDQVRLVSTDETVATIEYTVSMDGLGTITIHKAGECDIYAVHDITDYYCYDSVAFHLTVLPAPAPQGEEITPNVDPENPTVYYSTFYDSANKYALPAGVEAYVATLDGANLLLSKIADAGQTIPADNAVILKSSVTPFTLTPSDAEAVPVNAINSLQGTDVSIATPANCYVLAGNEGVGFYHYTASMLNPHKAYVIYSGSQAPGRMRFIFDQATGVESVQPSAISSQKVIENGQLFIIKNGVKYNAQGQIVK